jgi:hypothetical protein
LLTPFACSVVYLMGRNRALSIPRMDHTLYCIRRRTSGGARVSRRASACWEWPATALCYAPACSTGCHHGSPTYLHCTVSLCGARPPSSRASGRSPPCVSLTR